MCTFVLVFVACHLLMRAVAPPVSLDRVRVPSYSTYEYTTLASKVSETLSQSKCTYFIQKHPAYNVSCTRDVIFSPASYSPLPHVSSFVDFSSHMCSLTRFRMTRFRRGCLHDPPLPPHIGHLHPYHVRCNVPSSLCPARFQPAPRIPSLTPFLLHTTAAIVARSGFLIKPCGYIALRASCKVDDDAFAIARVAALENQRCFTSDCELPKYDHVFVATQFDDTQIGQVRLFVYCFEF